MDISIVIPTYDRLGLLQRTLRSLCRLTYPRERFEVIVVDDGSGDGTAEWMATQAWPFPLRCVRHEMNRFAAAARNTGIREARGEIIVLLDDDMEVEHDFLDVHMRCHQGGQEVAVVGNMLPAPDVAPSGLVRYLSTRGVHKLKQGQAMPFKYWCSGNASVRRSLLVEVGLFDEEIRHYGGEDLELAFRLHKRGTVQFCYADRAVSFHFHYRHVEDVCHLMFQYGQTSLAHMISRHPDLAPHVKANLVEPLQPGQDPAGLLLKKFLWRLAMNPVFCSAVKRFASISRTGKPAWLFDYLIACHYLGGLQRALKVQKKKAG